MLENDDELAMILGHEVAHKVNQDSAENNLRGQRSSRNRTYSAWHGSFQRINEHDCLAYCSQFSGFA